MCYEKSENFKEQSTVKCSRNKIRTGKWSLALVLEADSLE